MYYKVVEKKIDENLMTGETKEKSRSFYFEDEDVARDVCSYLSAKFDQIDNRNVEICQVELTDKDLEKIKKAKRLFRSKDEFEDYFDYLAKKIKELNVVRILPEIE